MKKKNTHEIENDYECNKLHFRQAEQIAEIHQMLNMLINDFDLLRGILIRIAHKVGVSDFK